MSIRPVILAEDNEKLRRMYGDMLESKGYQVMGASDGEKAIGLLHKIPNPTLIILDVMMPKLDGIETCRRIRKMQGLNNYCPIVFLTALDNPETMLECLNAGGDDFLMKSAPMADVVKRVQYWTRQASADENNERRKKAIKELEEIMAEADEPDPTGDGEDVDDKAAVNELADFINNESPFGKDDHMLCHFGYAVGLVNASFKKSPKSARAFSRFLRNLIYKTSCIDRKEVDALLDNYERVISQSQFQQGWVRGRDDAPKVKLSQQNDMASDVTQEVAAT